MAGERAEGQQGAQKSRIGDRPLKCGFWNLIEEVFEHQVKGSLVSIEKIHLLEEEDNDIDQHQTAQAQCEDLSNIFKKPFPFPLDKIERFSQPNNWFKRRFTGRLDEEIDAETTEEKIGDPTC
jgi:hypothetical protein